MLRWAKARAGRAIARYLEADIPGYARFSTVPHQQMKDCLHPCDVVLVEGCSRVSSAIKYVTHSTWSHAAFFAGHDRPGEEVIEAVMTEGVRSVPLDSLRHLNLRICRPVGLSATDRSRVVGFMRQAVGRQYDLRNVVDLARYLLPNPPVPARFRRRLLALGSGDPTRAICSTLIAEAFQSVRYPILPEVTPDISARQAAEILHIRHHSLFAPRDFDLSPYFRIVKPTLEAEFSYRNLKWADDVVTGDEAGNSVRVSDDTAQEQHRSRAPFGQERGR